MRCPKAYPTQHFLARITIFATCLFAAFSSQAQTTEKSFSGIPLYQIYGEKDLKSTSRGFFITSSPNNTTFFSSENGLLSFDGTSWNQLLESKRSHETIRSIAWIDGEVFAGSYSSVGRITFDGSAGASYVPINQTPLTNDSSEFYFKIIPHGNLIYFIGMRSVVTFDRNNESLVSKSFNSWVKTAFIDNESFYISTDRGGMWKKNPDGFELLPSFDQFKSDRYISYSAKTPNGRIAFATANGELHWFEHEKPINAFEKFENVAGVSNIIFLDEDRLAIAIPGTGIKVIATDGSTLTSLNHNIDYRWAGARSLHVDELGTLWAMLGSTIGKVLATNPITPIDERLRPSLDYAIAQEFEGNIFVRSSNKLYKATHLKNGQLKGLENAIPDSTISVSLALPTSDGILFVAEDRLYLLRNDEIIEMGNIDQIDRLTVDQNDPNIFIGTSSTTIQLLKRNGDHISVVSKISHTIGSINKIAQDKDNYFWLEVGLGSLGKTWIEGGELKFKNYTTQDGLPTDWISVWKNEGEVQFIERTGLFIYNKASERFMQSDLLELYFPRAEGALHRLATDPLGNIWATYNHSNYILRKKTNGTYEKDTKSLSNLGGSNINHYLFLENGDAILLSATEMFHFDGNLDAEELKKAAAHITEIANIEGNEIYYLNPGLNDNIANLTFNSKQDSIVIRIANTYSDTTKQPSFQYYLEGMSKDWSKWSDSNELVFNNLRHRNYNLKIRTKIGEDLAFPEASLSFTVEPSLFETTGAYFAYLVIGLSLIGGGFQFFSRNLKNANQTLEQMVAERTGEIESKNQELQHNALELTETLDELRSAQDQLMTTSRKAGMAEVATNVLHNVGNVLNSINVAVITLANNLEQNKIDKLTRVSELICSQEKNLPDFFTNTAKGKAIPQYLTQLSNVLKEDFHLYNMEVESMRDNIDHVKEIIATQQGHAKTVQVFQEINISELVESAISLIMGDVEHSIFEVSRTYDDDLTIVSDKHLILQMIANFVKNAKEAIGEANPPLGMIDINGNFDETRENIHITVRDNGSGITSENLQKIFTHGFTTKEDGHGFGMHSCANSAKVLGGMLTIDSKGTNKGSVVILQLPVTPPSKEDE